VVTLLVLTINIAWRTRNGLGLGYVPVGVSGQALRLPKEFRFDEDEVVIKKIGDMVILLPKTYKVEALLAMFEEIGSMEIEKEQLKKQQERDFE
jgi:antitoxin VapB